MALYVSPGTSVYSGGYPPFGQTVVPVANPSVCSQVPPRVRETWPSLGLQGDPDVQRFMDHFPAGPSRPVTCVVAPVPVPTTTSVSTAVSAPPPWAATWPTQCMPQTVPTVIPPAPDASWNYFVTAVVEKSIRERKKKKKSKKRVRVPSSSSSSSSSSSAASSTSPSEASRRKK